MITLVSHDEAKHTVGSSIGRLGGETEIHVAGYNSISLLLRVFLGRDPDDALLEEISALSRPEEMRKKLRQLASVSNAFPELEMAYEIRALREAARSGTVRLVIGAASTEFADWVPTNQSTLDLLKPHQWCAWLEQGGVSAILAEHVWEHLTVDQGRVAIRTCREFLSPGGRLRIAVPDGYFRDPNYIDYVSTGRYPGHLTLYNIDILSELLRDEGFQVRPLEFFDKSGNFHERFWSPQNGAVMRSRHCDPRNPGGRLRFTSLIVYGVKPSDFPISYKFTLGEATVPQLGWSALNPLEFLSLGGESLADEYTPCGKALTIVTEHWIDKLSADERTLAFKNYTTF